MATATCPHGFAPGSCLICQTLGTGPTATRETRPSSGRRRDSTVRLPSGEVEVLSARASRTPIKVRLLGGVIVLGVAAVAAWWIVTLVWAVFHLLEIVAAAAVFGYAGWRLGVHHGRRHPL